MRPIEKITIQLASKAVELSEYKNYLELTNRVCFYNEPNYNGVRLPYGEDTLAKAKTLVGMPVVAKYIVDSQGKPNLLDHCVSVDVNGDIQFNTESVGTHIDVWIADDTVETCSGEIKSLPCLFAKMKIWTRHTNYIEAIKRLYQEDSLHNSWEISSFSYSYDNGVKTLGDYIFEANALLGSYVSPAYGKAAKILDISETSKQTELLVASALSADLMAQNSDNTAKEEEDSNLENTENKILENEELPQNPETLGEPVVEEKEEVPAIEEAEESVPEQVCQSCLEKAEALSTANSRIDELNSKLEELNSKINEMNSQIEALAPFKAAYEEAEAERIRHEREALIESMKKDAEDSNCFSSEELEGDELKAIFDSAEVDKLKIMIADRNLMRIRQEKTNEAATSKVATTIKTELANEENKSTDYLKIAKEFLK